MLQSLLDSVPQVGMLWIPIAFAGYLLYDFAKTTMDRRGMPPGPTPLPLVGNALALLGRPLWVTFAKLREVYGDIYSVRVGSRDIVVINGYSNIQKALVSNSKYFSHRPDITWTSITQKKGIFSADGGFHHTQRAAVRRMLTDLRWDNTENCEARIQDEINNLCEWLSSLKGPTDLQLYLDTVVCNVNSKPIMGVTFTPTDDLMKAVSKIAMEIFIDAGAQNVNNYFTFLRNLPGDPTNFKNLVKNATTAMGVIEGVVQKHKEKLQNNPDGEKTDLTDLYLEAMAKKSDETFSDEQLIAALTDLFAMGIEATSTTLRWVVWYLCQNPKSMKKVQDEIDEIIGQSEPAMAYSKGMNYTRAVIAETQRLANVVSINLPHAASQDVQFMGYTILQGAIVIPNLASIHYDPNNYNNPMTFDPSRHLVDGEYVKPEKFAPYSLGTRMCLGNVLSEMQLFLFTIGILQKFDISVPNSNQSYSDIYGLIRYPGAYQVKITKRGLIA